MKKDSKSASGAVDLPALSEAIKHRGIKESVLDDVREVFSECEMVRYASVRVDKQRMAAAYKLTERIIDRVERS